MCATHRIISRLPIAIAHCVVISIDIIEIVFFQAKLQMFDVGGAWDAMVSVQSIWVWSLLLVSLFSPFLVLFFLACDVYVVRAQKHKIHLDGIDEQAADETNKQTTKKRKEGKVKVTFHSSLFPDYFKLIANTI